MKMRLASWIAPLATTLGLATLAGCSPVSLVMSATGVATDTSMAWDIVKHLAAKITEDDPRSCFLVNSVQRALNGRCGAFVPGSLVKADIANSGYSGCIVDIAVRDPKLWAAMPELIEKGAQPSKCAVSPLSELAQLHPCPDFSTASPAVLAAIRNLAETDPRAVRHDVFRMLSCPSARLAGLDHVLEGWLDQGRLEPGKLSFSPLGALHADMLTSRFSHELEVAGHTAESALGSYDGSLPGGFEEALRTSDWAALEWWLYRLPRLATKVPPTHGGELAWLPLQRVLVPSFLAAPGTRPQMVAFLMQHGADPWARLPFDPDRSIVNYAQSVKSPLLAMLDPPIQLQPIATMMAKAPSGDAESRDARGAMHAQALRAR